MTYCAPESRALNQLQTLFERQTLGTKLRRGIGALLGKFLESIRTLPGQVQSALARGRLAKAERAVRSLKGVAANIGASQCSALSGDLEPASRHERTYGLALADSCPLTTALLAHLERLEQLQQLQHNLQQNLLTASTGSSAPTKLNDPVEISELSHVCSALAGVLDANNVETELLLQSQSEMLRASFGAAFAGLQRQVQEFDFLQASETLHEAAAAHINLD